MFMSRGEGEPRVANRRGMTTRSAEFPSREDNGATTEKTLAAFAA